MIDRYTRPEMGHIFSLENKYRIWQEIEVLACEAHAEMGKIGITREEAAWIREHAAFNKDEVDAIEAVTNHDVIAFLTNMGEYIDRDVPEGEPKPSRWVHFGMTSSDLGDTALCYQLVQATDILIEDCKKLGEICRRRAFEERDTLCVGRTHGIHAEPMTFGMKFGSWAWELKRDYDRLKDARANVAFGAISGAVGTYSSIDPFVEEYVCEHLGLVHDPLSTQVAPGPRPRPAVHTGHLPRPPRLPRRRPGHHRRHLRAHRHGDPQPPEDRHPRGRGAVPQGPEGQLGHAAQAQSHHGGEGLRPLPRGEGQRAGCL